ncbi:MAG: serine protease [Treponema sp.]|jgi:serine protease Do|nr:serine protease [Treponema sp.]
MNLITMQRTTVQRTTTQRRILCTLGILLAVIAPASAQSLPAQTQTARETGTLRDYVGHISQSFQPEFAGFMGELKGELERRGQQEAAGSIERYLRGNAGTGFVYVAVDGANYIITSYQTISLASGLSIRFEGTGAAVYTGLSIVAVDEELDIALLAFENGARPFTHGLSLLQRPPREEETVYSAGFSGGNDAVWQFAEGVISRTYVRIPAARIPGDNETMLMQGPYIRHSARTDQENPAGLLLTAEPGSPAGYAVAGINSSSAPRSAGADWNPAYAIPIDRVENFLTRALGEPLGNNWMVLEERLLAFSRLAGLRSPYWHIASCLSARYIADNTADIIPALNNASGTAIEELIKAFNYSPVRGLNLAVAWAVENRLRNGKPGAAINIEVEVIEMLNPELYHVDFLASGVPDGALWIYERGIWKILSFGNPAAEPPTTPAPPAPPASPSPAAPREPADPAKLRTSYLFTFSVGYGHIFTNTHTFMAETAQHVWVLAFGTRIYYGGPSYLRGEGIIGIHIPIRIKNRVGLIPFTGAGIGLVKKDSGGFPATLNGRPTSFGLSVPVQGGLRITSSLVPGLFLQGMYLYEVFTLPTQNPHAFAISVGYGF